MDREKVVLPYYQDQVSLSQDIKMVDITPSYEPSFFQRLNVSLFKWVNQYIPWHRLPKLIGALNLDALRIELRQKNLHDGYGSGEVQGLQNPELLKDNRYLNSRHSDGLYNSLELPKMGCAGMRFGRNFPREYTGKPSEKDLFTPNPRMLSELFMERKKFIPATTLNLLAAAWIQFQTHDWFHHDSGEKVYNIPKPAGDKWPHGDMTLLESKPDDVLDASDQKCPGYKNTATAWWDASQIYGSSEAATSALRDHCTDGKLALTKDKREQFLPRDAAGNVKTGFNDNWWIGLEILHTLFALEHNAICDKLKQAYPDMPSDEIFDKARLVNCALMAKIHTVEWTPAILGHPTLQLAMNANWWGLAGEAITKNIGRLSKTSEVISGIPGSGADQHGCPYSLTEEFVSVYRMHSLIPDTVAFFDAQNGKHRKTIPIKETLFEKSQDCFDDGLEMVDAFYTFGINYPGAITNSNYPDFLRDLKTPDGQAPRDLGTVDLLRDRERGVPRYCQFRRMLHMPAPKTFEELTGGDKELAKKLSDAYNGDIEKVDTLIGTHSEKLPAGFGFSDTAFRIFVLMASRRLKSDRFIAKQWNNETYTKEGLHWVQHTTMKDVLIRHFPDLTPMLKGQKNVFAPWTKLPASREYKGIETNA